MVKRKDRRKSGWYTPVATCSKKELIKNNLIINEEYDDWKDFRDGMRDWFRDFKQIKNINESHKKEYMENVSKKEN
ncbi:MAG: hypothetical protein WC755_08430 [Candidatus Woesearchaeota archaeon]|jgi:hypothetical protein